VTDVRGLFSDYVTGLLVTRRRGSMAGALPRPERPGFALPPHLLEAILDDARTLEAFAPGVPQDVATGRQLRAVMHVALWLPTVDVPTKLASRAARFRFLAWTFLPRLGHWPPPAPLRLNRLTWPSGGTEPAPADQTWVIGQAGTAREAWLSALSVWEDDPWLRERQIATPDAFERDLRWLTVTWSSEPRHRPGAAWPHPPAALDLTPPGTPAELRRAERERLLEEAAETHWLPRGAVTKALAARWPDRPRRRLVTLGLPGVFTVTLLILLVCGQADVASWTALAAVGTGLIGLPFVSVRLTSLAMLRIPVAIQAGELLLLTLTPRWWTARDGWMVGLGLIIAATAYLVLESRMHDNRVCTALRRGGLIATFGVCCAVPLSLIALRFVVPQLGEHGECLAGADSWWRAGAWTGRTLTETCRAAMNTTDAAAPVGVLTLMVGFSFAAGLAAQTLVDDRPITAPLGRVRRTRKGQA
jgi:hypothetical protein